MPDNIVKSFADKSGKSVDEVETLWDKAKKITKDQYDVDVDSDRFYQITTGMLKNMLGIEEKFNIDLLETYLND